MANILNSSEARAPNKRIPHCAKRLAVLGPAKLGLGHQAYEREP